MIPENKNKKHEKFWQFISDQKRWRDIQKRFLGIKDDNEIVTREKGKQIDMFDNIYNRNDDDHWPGKKL